MGRSGVLQALHSQNATVQLQLLSRAKINSPHILNAASEDSAALVEKQV